jgi:hypothetical protein
MRETMKKILLIIPFLFLIGLPTHSVAGWFGSDTYEECLLDEDVGDARTKEAVREIKKACKKRHAKDFWSSNFDNWRTKYPNQFNNLSDCEFVKKFQSVTKDGNKYFVDNFGVNPSTCD